MGDKAHPMSDFPELYTQSVRLLEAAAKSKQTIATAESCTGGLVASLLTDVEGYGECFDRGFIVYTDEAKAELLAVDPVALRTYGAVSRPIANQMAKGALMRSRADLALAITGFAGPAGPRDEEGLVFLEAHARSGRVISRECHYGPAGRDRVRNLTAAAALEMLMELLQGSATA